METVSKTGQESDEACEQCFKKKKKLFFKFCFLGFLSLAADEKLSKDGEESPIREDDSKLRKTFN